MGNVGTARQNLQTTNTIVIPILIANFTDIEISMRVLYASNFYEQVISLSMKVLFAPKRSSRTKGASVRVSVASERNDEQLDGCGYMIYLLGSIPL